MGELSFIESFSLENTFKIIESDYQLDLLSAISLSAMSTQYLNSPRDGDSSIAPGHPFQCHHPLHEEILLSVQPKLKSLSNLSLFP